MEQCLPRSVCQNRFRLGLGKNLLETNFGGDSEMPNIETVKAILQKLGKPESLISYVTDRLGHDRRYAIDSSFAQRELNWKPLHNFREGLDSAIDWYATNRAWWEPLLERTGRH